MGFFKKLFGISENNPPDVPKIKVPIEIKVITNIGSPKTEKFRGIVQDVSGNWILNPGASFLLTLLNAAKTSADQIRAILDNDDVYDYKKVDKIVGVFAAYNIKVKEIEEYKIKYKSKYFQNIEKQKNESSEWQRAGVLDKEDLLAEFRKKAIGEIYERACCEINVLFEDEPSDITIDDDLIKKYGYDALKAYIRFSDNIEKVRVIPNDNYNRPIFEKLVDLDLAKRGQDIQISEILPSLTLKELNSISENGIKEFKRKNQAIEYILSLDDLNERISNKISLRELFQLKPLPVDFTSLDLKKIASAWKYHDQEVKLLVDTFRISFYSMKNTNEALQYIKSYNIQPLDKIDPCPCAKDLSMKKFNKNNRPNLPIHVGCNCFLNAEYNF